MNGNNRLMRASDLRGTDVKNRDWEDLGEIDDLMIDVQNGCIGYAVVSFGGILGIGDKLFAIPWGAISIDADEKVAILDVAREDLENAPGFDKNTWPDMANQAWAQGVHDFYKARPYWEIARKK